MFTPGLNDAKRPVLLWIHGGGWREFSGTAPGFNGTHLARAQNVVVITVNHRLHGFDFLQLDGSDERFADSGNTGLLDIVMALTWVRDNVATFGGDPNNVTLFGESGGASKLAAILAMPAAQGLFHKAIIQSSAGGLRLADPEEAGRQAATLAKALGCRTLDGDALQQVPMETLLAAFAAAGGPFRGMIDGRSFAADPFHPTASSISVHVPIMAGCTNTESMYYLRADAQSFSLSSAEITKRLSRFFNIDTAQTEKIIEAYRPVYLDDTPSSFMIMITSDYMFKRNTYRMATLQAASASAPVYAYLFDRETPIEGGRMRSPHTTEVPFIFGTATDAAAHVGTGSDIHPMTACMMATWAAFARHGDPNNPTLPQWKPYTDADRHTMILNVDNRLAVDPGGEARAALKELPFFGYSHSIDAFAKA